MNPRDRSHYRVCLDCDALVLPPRRKCNSCRKTKYTVVELRPGNKGRNARGLAVHRADKVRTRRPKRQNPEMLGSTPDIRMSNWRFI